MSALTRYHLNVDRLLASLLLGIASGFTVSALKSDDLPWPLLAIVLIAWVEVLALAWLLWVTAPKAARLDAADNALADAGRWPKDGGL